MIQNKAQSLENQQSLLNMIQNPSTYSFTNKKSPKFHSILFFSPNSPKSEPILKWTSPFHHPKTLNFSSKVQGATLQGVTRSEVVQKAVEVPKRPSDRPGFEGMFPLGVVFLVPETTPLQTIPTKTHESHKLLRSARSPDLPTGSVLVSIQLFEHLSHPGAIPVPWIQSLCCSGLTLLAGWCISGPEKQRGGTLFFVLFRLYFMDFCWSLHVQVKLYQSHCLFIFVSLNCIYSALIIGNSPTQWT